MSVTRFRTYVENICSVLWLGTTRIKTMIITILNGFSELHLDKIFNFVLIFSSNLYLVEWKIVQNVRNWNTSQTIMKNIYIEYLHYNKSQESSDNWAIFGFVHHNECLWPHDSRKYEKKIVLFYDLSCVILVLFYVFHMRVFSF